jgi:hypothetical protein
MMNQKWPPCLLQTGLRGEPCFTYAVVADINWVAEQ